RMAAARRRTVLAARRQPRRAPARRARLILRNGSKTMTTRGLFCAYDDVWILDGVRTPFVDYCGAFGELSPTDMGIKVARAVLERSAVAPTDIGVVIAGNMAPGDFDQFFLPRHVALYSGVPMEVPALMVQRICGTGFEL